jgi:hypothetical protein
LPASVVRAGGLVPSGATPPDRRARSYLEPVRARQSSARMAQRSWSRHRPPILR